MRGLAHSWRLWLTRPAAILFMLLNFMVGGAAAVPTLATAIANGHMIPAIGANPQYAVEGTADPSVRTFSCQLTTPAGCYGPAQIQAAYNIQPLLNAGINGAGHTIVIVDAFQSPTIVHDLQTFDQLFGLPDPTLNIIAPQGLTPFNQSDPNQVGWAGEITLDVEWSHAVAPGATIDLVLSADNSDANILAVTQYAIDNNLGDVISQSFGEGEICAGTNTLSNSAFLAEEHAVFNQAAAKHITLLASSGDQGAAQPTCDGSSLFLSVSTPASDPDVTAVGGTRLLADGLTGAYQGDIAWNEPNIGSSGGGFSTIYSRPSYQEHVPGIAGWRGVPDVAYNAAVIGGVLTVWSSSGRGANLVFRFGGTSAGSPQWAGITVLANQKAGKRLGFLNTAIYSIGKSDGYAKGFHDVTSGNNSFGGVTGYNTTTGWDAVTGWGTPNVANLVPLLIQRIVGGSLG